MKLSILLPIIAIVLVVILLFVRISKNKAPKDEHKKHVKSLLAELRAMDISGQNTDQNAWFAEHILEFGRSQEALEFINDWGHIEAIYWKELGKAENPEEDEVLQLNLITVTGKNGSYWPKFFNLLYGYLKRWDFSDDVKKGIRGRDYAECIRRAYLLAKNKPI